MRVYITTSMDLISDINFSSSANVVDNASKSTNFLNIDQLTASDAVSITKETTSSAAAAAVGVCDPTRFTNFLMSPDLGSQFSTSVTSQHTLSPWITPDRTGFNLNSAFQTTPNPAAASGSLYNHTSAAAPSTAPKFDFNTTPFDFNSYNAASAAWSSLDMYNTQQVVAPYQCQPGRLSCTTALSACSPAKFASTYPSINGFYYTPPYNNPYGRYSRALLGEFDLIEFFS